MTPEAQFVGQLETAVALVTRHLPEAHVLTRRFRALRFRVAAEHFLSILDKVDVSALTDEELEEVERLTRVGLKSVEIHFLMRYGESDTADCRYFTELVQRFRNAVEALESGLSTAPSQQPTKAELLDSLAARLERAGVR